MATGAINAVRNMVTEIANWVGAKLNAVWDSVKAKIDTVKTAFHGMYDAVVGHSYVPDMVKGIGESIAQLQQLMVDPSLSATQKVGAAFQSLAGLVGSLFGQKAGGLLSSIGGLVSALAPLLGGSGLGKSIFPVVGGVDPLAPLPKMANGGGGVFGGMGGVDKNVLSLNGSPIARVSKGESWSVGANDAPMARVLIVPTPYFDAHVDGRAAMVAAPMAGQAAIAGASGGVMSLQRRASRTLP
jgi:hypothetical protein